MERLEFYQDEMPENYEQKCPVVMVIDRSISMSGASINELNKGLQEFEQEISSDQIASNRLDLAIVSFGSDTTLERDFSLITSEAIPTININGGTNIIAGINEGMRILEERKAWYKSTGQTYYRPYLVFITDGGAPIGDLPQQIRSKAEAKALNFWAIGVKDADMNVLEQLCCPDVNGSLAPLTLNGLKFVELFKWLSSSFTKVSNNQDGEEIDLTPDANNNPFAMTV